MRTERLTGNVRFRNGLFGRQILQVEICGENFSYGDWSPTYYAWRDAKSYEAHHVKMNFLIGESR